MKPLASLLLAVALATSATAAPIQFGKSEGFDYAGALAARVYNQPEQALDDIRSLTTPWNHMFTIPVGGEILMPGPEHWQSASIPFKEKNIAVVEASAGIPDGSGVTSANTAGVHVVLLLQRNNRRWFIADHMILRDTGLTDTRPVVIPHESWGHLLHLDRYIGGYRMGTHTHTLFVMAPQEPADAREIPLNRWHPALQVDTRYSQFAGSQVLRFGAAPRSSVAATVITEPGNAGTPPAGSKSVTLNYDTGTAAFDAAPLTELVLPVDGDEGAPQAHPWIINPGKSIGPVTHHSTFEDLTAVFGTDNVKRDKIAMGEGETADGIVVYPESENRLELVFGPGGKIVQANIHGSKTKWVTDAGITLGSTPSAVQDANGKPFEISDFEWDYPGLVESWDEGVLNDDLRVQFSYRDEQAYQKLYKQTEAAGRWHGVSDSDGMRSLDLHVTSIYVVLKP